MLQLPRFADASRISVDTPMLSRVQRCFLPWLWWISSFGSMLLASGCGSADRPPLPDDELVVLTRNAPTTYFIDQRDRITGPEYDMAVSFGRFLGLPVRFEVLDSIGEVIAALEAGRGHFAAAGLTRTPEREGRFAAGPTYQVVDELVMCGPGVGVEDESDLPEVTLAVIAGSSYVETLSAVREREPGLTWQAVAGESSEELLQSVADGIVDCTIADSSIVAMHRPYLPELEEAFPAGSEKELAWLLAPGQSNLGDALNEWFEQFEAAGQLNAVMNHYYGHLDQYDAYDIRVFEQRVGERLPQYRELFEQAADETGLPWTLLAAVAYQESYWNPEATSPTGVRGMMMLTGTTATALGVEDRLDPAASIIGGARYLEQMLARVPPSVPAPDRVWMALAAYNVGYSHLRDARMLAVYLGVNPNLWSEVKDALPRLSESRYYSQLPAGYASGVAAAIYVERIRNFHDLLETFLGEQP